jgi:hypothetical protein
MFWALLEMQLLKNNIVNSQPSQHTSAEAELSQVLSTCLLVMEPVWPASVSRPRAARSHPAWPFFTGFWTFF